MIMALVVTSWAASRIRLCRRVYLDEPFGVKDASGGQESRGGDEPHTLVDNISCDLHPILRLIDGALLLAIHLVIQDHLRSITKLAVVYCA